jgi:hypothetical protein
MRLFSEADKAGSLFLPITDTVVTDQAVVMASAMIKVFS